MERSYLIALVVAVIIIAIIVFAVKRNKPIYAANPAPLPSPAPIVPATLPPIAPSAVTYTFYPRKDSYSPYFGQRADLIGNVPALKAACEATPGCVGFNTNGWLYKSLNPQSTWLDWNGPAGCGIYVRNN